MTMVDDDVINTHNLATQFLYREKHLGKKKCQIAADTMRSQQIDHIVAYTDRLSSSNPDSKQIFSDRLFLGMDCVISAMDNWIARAQLDAKCLANQIPLIDCGTLGSGSVLHAPDSDD